MAYIQSLKTPKLSPNVVRIQQFRSGIELHIKIGTTQCQGIQVNTLSKTLIRTSRKNCDGMMVTCATFQSIENEHIINKFARGDMFKQKDNENEIVRYYPAARFFASSFASSGLMLLPSAY